MPYGTTTRGTNWPTKEPWQVRLLRALLWFVPRANPDNEPLYPQLRRWALELDDGGKPLREVGLGEGDVVLFRAPDERNFGFWTDSAEAVPGEYLLPLDQQEFESLWRRAANREA